LGTSFDEEALASALHTVRAALRDFRTDSDSGIDRVAKSSEFVSAVLGATFPEEAEAFCSKSDAQA